MFRPIQSTKYRFMYFFTPWSISKWEKEKDIRGSTIANLADAQKESYVRARERALKHAKRAAIAELGVWRKYLRQSDLDYRESVRTFSQIKLLSIDLETDYKADEKIHRRRMLIHSLRRNLIQ